MKAEARAVPQLIVADLEQLKRLLGAERRVLVDFLVALERFDRLKMFEPLGYPGLWPFLERELGLLKCATFQRFWGCRLIRSYPSAIDRLRDGRLALSTFVMLRDALTPSNAEAMFDEIRGKSREDVKKLLEEVTGSTAIPTENGRSYTIRKAPLPAAVPATASVAALRVLTFADPRSSSGDSGAIDQSSPEPVAPSPCCNVDIDGVATSGAGPGVPAALAAPHASSTPAVPELIVPNRSRPTEISPTSGGLYDVSMRVKGRFVELLREAAKAESHVVPDGDPEALLTRGLELIVEKYRKKIGKTPVRSSRARRNVDTNSNDIPAALLREVFEHDGYKCVWPMADGGICGSQRGLEADHVTPLAKGGKTEAKNLRCVCHEHNQQAAREAFGEAHIARKIAESRGRTAAK